MKLRDIITDADATYDNLKDALIGCGTLTFSHASENLMSAERGHTLMLPLRQAIQKWQRLLEKLTSEATSIKEACTYVAVAVTRYNTNPDLKLYLDMKGDFTKDLFCRTADEWLASKPAGTKWSKRQFNTEYKDRSMTGNQPQRPGSVRKQGGCYFCGKPGHYAQECRSRIASERGVPQQPQKPLPPVVTKEQVRQAETWQR